MLDTSDAVLLVVDVQDSILKVIYEQGRVVDNTIKLIEAAKVLGMPVIVTVQNREKLGDCTDAIIQALPESERLSKMTFSCMGSPGFAEELAATDRKQVLICGIETHVCVTQTALDLLDAGYRVQVVKDAVSSRTAENWLIGIEKMRDVGCVITSTEAAILEGLRDASRPEFREIRRLIK